MVINDALCKAALDGIAAVFNSGTLTMSKTGPTTVGSVTFGSTAFGAATTANPSVAASNTITSGAIAATGIINAFAAKTSGGATRLSGTVGLTASGADLELSAVDTTGFDTLACDQLVLTLTLTA